MENPYNVLTMSGSASEKQYLVGAFVQACKIMGAFRKPGEALLLSDVVARTGLQKGTVFRLLYTLHHEGFLEKTPRNQYRLRISLPRRNKLRFGYSANEKDGFTRLVTESLCEAAAGASIEIVCTNNKASVDLALENAEALCHERVDLAIVFFGDHAIGDALSTRFLAADIPMIAIDVPYPGATYFGANNYQAGLIAGRHMGHWAKLHWKETCPTFLLIGYARAGSLVQARVRGMLAGTKETWKTQQQCRFVALDSIGDFDSSYEAVRDYLNLTPSRHTMIGAVNDPAVLGALRAFEQAGRTEHCAAIGHNAEWDARTELRRSGTKLIGSVAYFPERYGRGIIALAGKILNGTHVPPGVMTKHVLVTQENLDRLYPNDALMSLNLLNENGDV
jgi:ribose transport system substrate-binding protein